MHYIIAILLKIKEDKHYHVDKPISNKINAIISTQHSTVKFDFTWTILLWHNNDCLGITLLLKTNMLLPESHVLQMVEQ